MADSIIIFHYHLFPGGVTSVIRKGIEAISRIFSHFTIVVGHEEHCSAFIQTLTPLIDTLGIKVEVQVEPAIGYASRKPEGSPKELGDYLYQRYGGPSWWVHNYHLGKNPLFTGALLHLAETNREQRLYLQIHDFPECGRYENLRFLKSLIPETPLYPIRENIRYVLINKKDYRVLQKAGIPEKQLFYLPNPISKPNFPLPKKELAREKLFGLNSSAAIGNIFLKGKVFLYPVRTIRRKNVLEAGFITTIRKHSSLIATLPGTSESEIRYSNVVEECFKDGTIPGFWGVGAAEFEKRISFPDIIAASDTIVSSSVQEGFGYFFLEALQWKRPLLARRLDILDDFTDIFKHYPLHLYDMLLVPLEKERIEALLARYRHLIEDVKDILPERTREKLYEGLNTFKQDGLFDFSYLSVKEQQHQLTLSREKGYKETIKEINASLFNALESITNSPDFSRFDEDKLYATFGYDHFARRVEELFTVPPLKQQSTSHTLPKETKNRTNMSKTPGDIESAVLSLFSGPGYTRLLYR